MMTMKKGERAKLQYVSLLLLPVTILYVLYLSIDPDHQIPPLYCHSIHTYYVYTVIYLYNCIATTCMAYTLRFCFALHSYLFPPRLYSSYKSINQSINQFSSV